MSASPILVVDDDRRLAASIWRALAYEGCRVSLAEDGPSALKAARDSVPDLVILDVMMPGMDGVEICRRVGRQGRPPRGRSGFLWTTPSGTAAAMWKWP
jgi:DNA-binding response OmpR family regulator